MGAKTVTLKSGLTTPLPPSRSKRWLPKHKAEIVAAVADGRLQLREACERYALTPEELASWQAGLETQGLSGLRAKVTRERRKANRRTMHEPAAAMVGPEIGIRCFISDISARGARLEFRSYPTLPSSFDLLCAKTGRSVGAYVIWQKDRVVGVSFGTGVPSAIEVGIDAWLLGERA